MSFLDHLGEFASSERVLGAAPVPRRVANAPRYPLPSRSPWANFARGFASRMLMLMLMIVWSWR
jgi:hypothetical protein